jgi:putative glycosyltransferase (TIGR04348 family)
MDTIRSNLRVKISLITPAPPRSRTGNGHTAARWAHMLHSAGHHVTLTRAWRGADADLMIALHARRSHASIARYAATFPTRPLVVVLTGTDLYRDIDSDDDARRSLALATRLVVLQEAGVSALPRRLRPITRVIYQSAVAMPPLPQRADCFEVVVSGHLRDEKDPFCAARAFQYLPRASAIRVTHIGRALTDEMMQTAQQMMAREPRYQWLGELGHRRALRTLARARLLVVSSRMEGGANVVSEALVAGVPVIASRIPGNVGMLGTRYPGYYPLCDARALSALLVRAESDARYYARLRSACAARAHLVTPERELASLTALVEELERTTGARPCAINSDDAPIRRRAARATA